jgi:hypothetical protein
MPITTVNPPIRSVVKKVTKSIKEIRACLMARAIVEEILPDGKTVRLNISNYDQVLTDVAAKTETPVFYMNCNCGVCADCTDKTESTATTDGTKSEWQMEYDKYIASKSNGIMTRKQRRSLEAAARAAADAAVAKTKDAEPEVVMGVASIETPEVEEVIEVVEETPVETLDVETELVDNSNDVVEETTEDEVAEEVETVEASAESTDEVTE